MIRILPALAVLMLLVLPAAGQDFLKGMEAYDRGDFATMLREWRPLAAKGHADAQTGLGLMYFEGLGVPQDYAEAVRWYRLAAAQGLASAQTSLGFMYVLGQGVPQDYVQAHMWFNLATAQGSRNAVKGRDLAANEMTSAQIAEAQRLTREWLEKHGK